MPSGELLGVRPLEYTVIWPAGVTLPTSLVPRSVNQRLPSGPATMAVGSEFVLLFSAGRSEYSLTLSNSRDSSASSPGRLDLPFLVPRPRRDDWDAESPRR